MDMRAIAMTQNQDIKKRNPIAKILKFFTPKIIRDKKKYTRKIKYGKKTKIWA